MGFHVIPCNSTFHADPCSFKFPIFDDMSGSTEFYGSDRVVEIGPSSMEFHGTARVIDIGLLPVPWNSTECHGSVYVIEIGPWNSMELEMVLKSGNPSFKVIPWNIMLFPVFPVSWNSGQNNLTRVSVLLGISWNYWCHLNWECQSPTEFHGIFLWNLMEPFVSSKLLVFNLDRIVSNFFEFWVPNFDHIYIQFCRMNSFP